LGLLMAYALESRLGWTPAYKEGTNDPYLLPDPQNLPSKWICSIFGMWMLYYYKNGKL